MRRDVEDSQPNFGVIIPLARLVFWVPAFIGFEVLAEEGHSRRRRSIAFQRAHWRYRGRNMQQYILIAPGFGRHPPGPGETARKCSRIAGQDRLWCFPTWFRVF